MVEGELKAIYLAIVAVFVTSAAIVDFRLWKIPNWLTVPMFALGLVSRLVLEDDRVATLQDIGGGFAIGFGIPFLMWLMGSGGAGDVKLLGAVGVWLGSLYTVFAFVGSAIVVVIIELVRFVARLLGYQSREPDEGVLSSLRMSARRRRKVPYAVPLAIVSWTLLALNLLKLMLVKQRI